MTLTRHLLRRCSPLSFFWLGVVIAAALVLLPSGTALAQDDNGDAISELRPAGFLQQQFLADQTTDRSPRFRIHRARLGIAGPITERLSVNLIPGAVEPPDQAPRLVNAFVDANLHPLLKLRMGQFLVPFGLEGPEPIPHNPAIERSIASRRLNDFNMFRNVGVQVRGSRSAVHYAVALVNGAGANITETIDPKDGIGRVGLGLGDLVIGLSGHYGQRIDSDAPSETLQRLRWALDARYQPGPFRVRAEYLEGRDERTEADDRIQRGVYVLGAYRSTNDWEAIVRLGVHDPDTATEDDSYTGLTVGGSHYFDGWSRVSLNYEFREDTRAPDTGNLLTVQMQIAF